MEIKKVQKFDPKKDDDCHEDYTEWTTSCGIVFIIILFITIVCILVFITLGRIIGTMLLENY